MIELNLSNGPRWLDLIASLRLQLRPLTTSLMVAARADPAIQDLASGASDDERAVAFAKALARLAILGLEGWAMRAACHSHLLRLPLMRCWISGRCLRRSRPNMLPKAC